MTAERDGAILEVRGLSIAFETDEGTLNALRDVSFSIAPGETFGLAGESGSGKSSLAFAIMSYLPSNAAVTAGRILFAGDDVLGVGERALRTIRGNRIAMVYQDPKSALDPSMRVGEQVAEALELHAGMSRSQALERALALLELVNIGDAEAVARRYPHQLSGGMQQRVVIATALACDPELLIMDEPTTGLDVTTQARIIDLIGELKSKVRAALLFITHDLGVIAEVSDRVGILYAGELVEEAPKEALFRRPAHPYTRGLLAAIPAIERETALAPIPGNLPDLTEAVRGCVFAPRCGFVEAACRAEAPAFEWVAEGEQRAKCRRWRDVVASESAASASTRVAETLREEKVLTAENVTKHYDGPGALSRWLGREDVSVKAVDGVSMDVRSGEVFALVGESGCGKTTLGHCIIGLTSVTDGDITFRSWKSGGAGRKLETESELRRSAQMVFQHPDSSLNPMKTIRSILERPLIVHGTPRGERRERARELLRWVNLEEAFLRRYPYQLSGGEKQRVAIARAFALEPEFVLLDEPVSSLDVSVQAAIINLLVALKSEIGSAYLFISHDLGLVRTFANRVAVMYLGRLCELGPAKAVFDPPYHPYTRALLAAVPALDPGKRQTTVRLEGAVPSPRRPPSGCRFHTRCPSKIGRICEEVEPPVQEVGDGHWITCHIPSPELAREPPVWRREG